MERKLVSDVVGRSFRLRLPTVNEPDAIRLDQLVLARIDNGKAVAFVSRDDLFDEDGNRFYGDV